MLAVLANELLKAGVEPGTSISSSTVWTKITEWCYHFHLCQSFSSHTCLCHLCTSECTPHLLLNYPRCIASAQQMDQGSISGVCGSSQGLWPIRMKDCGSWNDTSRRRGKHSLSLISDLEVTQWSHNQTAPSWSQGRFQDTARGPWTGHCQNMTLNVRMCVSLWWWWCMGVWGGRTCGRWRHRVAWHEHFLINLSDWQ